MVLQMQSYGPPKLKLHAWLKKCHFVNFSERAGMAMFCQYRPQESLAGFQRFLLFWVPIQQCWNAKLERALSFLVQSVNTYNSVVITWLHASLQIENFKNDLVNFTILFFQAPPSASAAPNSQEILVNNHHNKKAELNSSSSFDSNNVTCYRFGSVGQDTLLCLWDLTEDILKQVSDIKAQYLSFFYRHLES